LTRLLARLSLRTTKITFLSSHNLFRHLTCSSCFFHPLVSIRPLSCLHQTVYKPSTTPSNTTLIPTATFHRRWLFSDRPGILSAQKLILRNHLDLCCPLTTPLYLLCSTNMLPLSTNSPIASLHQTHGLLLSSVHFGLPSAMLKTFGNVLTLLLTGPPSSLPATNTTSSSCFPKKNTIPASHLQTPITQSVFSKQSINSYTANPINRFPPLLLTFRLQTALLLIFHKQKNIQTPSLSHQQPNRTHPVLMPLPPDFSVFTPASESEVHKILSNCPNMQSYSDPIPHLSSQRLFIHTCSHNHQYCQPVPHYRPVSSHSQGIHHCLKSRHWIKKNYPANGKSQIYLSFPK